MSYIIPNIILLSTSSTEATLRKTEIRPGKDK